MVPQSLLQVSEERPLVAGASHVLCTMYIAAPLCPAALPVLQPEPFHGPVGLGWLYSVAARCGHKDGSMQCNLLLCTWAAIGFDASHAHTQSPAERDRKAL